MVRSLRVYTRFALTLAATALGLMMLSAGPLGAADPAIEKPAEKPPVGITRADLAAAYLRLEEVYFANPPEGERRAEVNTAFDRATMAFFTGRNADAIQAIDAITESLAPQKPSPAERALVSLKATVDPPVWVDGSAAPASCRVTSLYSSQAPLSLKLTLRLLDANNKAVLEHPLNLNVGPEIKVDESFPLELASVNPVPGLYRVELKPEEGRAVVVGRLNVVRESLDAQRTANAQRLAKVKATSPALEQALASCQARNALSNDRPSAVNSAQFLVDLNQRAELIASEVSALEAGQNPYAGRRGDCWRVLKIGDGTLPFRVYAPEMADVSKPLPLLVVLHGMGGDENMFLEAYGAGIVKKLSEQHGILIASPLTPGIGSDGKKLDALVDALASDYAIDRQRIYVLGHSMGAGATAALARGNRAKIAAACCIAGGRFAAKPDTPPILVVSPELDLVVPAKSLQASATQAAKDGAPLELKILPGEGHTLAVGTALPEAVAWLLKHRIQSE